MQIHNTLTRKLEQFESERNVTVYVCGITPYDITHLGHAFLYVFFDVLMRHLESKGYTVTYAQNVTDIDDDILRKADELGMNYLDLAMRETERFEQDMRSLGVRQPNYYPRATHEISDIVEIISSLVERGNAYVREGNVYFDISTFPSYGELCKEDRDRMLALAQEHGGHPEDPLRDDPLDFMLWQASGPGEPSWPSPWSEGRPGWHIECSEMAMKYLGRRITIHGGGADLVFPHHESERAQSESYTSLAPFVKYWVHVAMLRYHGEKMSKSLGNLVLIGDLLKAYTPDAVRLALLSHHYRTEWEFTDDMMDSAQALADKLARSALLTSGKKPAPIEDKSLIGEFDAALDNDMDSPAAIAALERLADTIERYSDADTDISDLQHRLRKQSAVMGLTLQRALERKEAPA